MKALRAAVFAVCATLGCGAPTQVSIGRNTPDVVAPIVDVAVDAAVEAGAPDVGAPDVPAAPDATMGMLRPCMVNAECVGACPPMVRGCVCFGPVGSMRCTPACMFTPECPPGPMGMMLVCRMGACVP